MVTALRIQDKNLMIMTIPIEGKVYVEFTGCDENWQPVGIPEKKILEDWPEEDYHKLLREDANKKGQLVRQYSSNPELFPTKIIKLNNDENTEPRS